MAKAAGASADATTTALSIAESSAEGRGSGGAVTHVWSGPDAGRTIGRCQSTAYARAHASGSWRNPRSPDGRPSEAPDGRAPAPRLWSTRATVADHVQASLRAELKTLVKRARLLGAEAAADWLAWGEGYLAAETDAAIDTIEGIKVPRCDACRRPVEGGLCPDCD